MVFFKKGEFKILWPFYFDSIFSNILFLYPIFSILYFRNIIGLNLFQIGLLTSVAGFASLFFEIPTGVIADIYGRKFSTILGFLMQGILMILIMFFSNFYILLIFFFLLGIAGTFISGADEAWVVDLLKHHRKRNLIHEYYQKRTSFANFGVFFAGLLGALVVKLFGINIIWSFTGISLLFTGIILIFAKEYFIRKEIEYGKNLKRFFIHTKNSFSYSFKKKSVLLLLISTIFLMFAIVFASDLTFYPLLQNFGFKDYWFGYLASAFSILGIFIPHFSKKFSDKLGGARRFLILLSIFWVLLLLSMLFVKTLGLVLIIYFLYMSVIPNIYQPARIVFFQNFIPSKMRATIGSLKNMLYSLSALLAAPLVGFLSDIIGIQRTIALGGILLIPVILIYLNVKEK